MNFLPSTHDAPEPTGSTAESIRQMLELGCLDLPPVGTGQTAARHGALIEIARIHPVGVARLVEAHTDAQAILHEAGRTPRVGKIYGVWASTGPNDPLLDGNVISGTKCFCTGLGIVDRALMTVSDSTGRPLLVDVDVRRGSSVTTDTDDWATTALADTATGSITLTDHEVDSDSLIGPEGWYLSRPGFWHGACGPAACWAGAALGLVDAGVGLTDEDPHRRAHLGAMVASAWSLQALIRSAGDDIDREYNDVAAGEHRARSLRHIVERTCTEILDRFGRSFGPRPFTTNVDVARRFADTHLYLRQHHGERELGALADLSDQLDSTRSR
jgi:hypothetical protein